MARFLSTALAFPRPSVGKVRCVRFHPERSWERFAVSARTQLLHRAVLSLAVGSLVSSMQLLLMESPHLEDVCLRLWPCTSSLRCSKVPCTLCVGEEQHPEERRQSAWERTGQRTVP